MPDFSKLKKKTKSNRFGSLPEKSSDNLDAPETEPAAKKDAPSKRTEPMSFKVTAEFKKEFKHAALENDQKLVDFLENCFELYKKYGVGGQFIGNGFVNE